MSIQYPVAETAEAALHAPRGFAAREREAGLLAHCEVAFVTEAVGPAFATRDAALDAYAGRIDDERPGATAVAPERRWCQLQAVSAPLGAKPRVRAPVKPTFRDGQRWPSPNAQPEAALLWRLSISYWRIVAEATAAMEQSARMLRRDSAGRELDVRALGALARQPLRATAPQQPLDIGLFEVRLPESPDIVVPDE